MAHTEKHPIRESRDFKADKRSQSPERTKDFEGSSEEEEETPEHEHEEERVHSPSMGIEESSIGKKKKKDRGLEITDEDLKMLKESSQGK